MPVNSNKSNHLNHAKKLYPSNYTGGSAVPGYVCTGGRGRDDYRPYADEGWNADFRGHCYFF